MKIWIVDDADCKIYGVYKSEAAAFEMAELFQEEHGKEFYVEWYDVED